MEKKSALEDLVVDDSEEAIDGLLRETLVPFVTLRRPNHVVTALPFLELSAVNRILVFLLARQAACRLQFEVTPEAGTDELHVQCQAPLKSVREYVSRLRTRRFLEKNEAGWFVPSWAIRNVAVAIQKTQGGSK